MSDSTWNDPRITAYALDELPDEERRAFECEMAANPRLDAAVQQARQITAALSAEWSQELDGGLSADAQSVLLSRMRAAPSADKATNGAVRAGRIERAAELDASTRLGNRFLAIAVTLLLLGGITTALLVAPRRQPTSVGMQTEQPAEAEESDFSDAPQLLSSLRALEERGDGESQRSTVDDSDSMRVEAPASAEPMVPADAPEKRASSPARQPSAGAASDAEATTALPAERQASRGYDFYAGPSPTPGSGTAAEPRPQSDTIGERLEGAQPTRSVELDFAKGAAPQQAAPEKLDEAEGYGGGYGGYGGGGYGGGYSGEVREGGYGAGYGGEASEPSYGNGMPEGYGGYGEEGYGAGYGAGGGYGGGYGVQQDARAVAGAEVGIRDSGVAADAERGEPFGVTRDLYRGREKLPAPKLQQLQRLNDQGRGPGRAGDRYDLITDNPFRRTREHPASTFSIDVDTASFGKVRQYLLGANSLPRPDAVRIEELVNYFDYGYQPPAEDAEHPFAAHMAVAECPWEPSHRLARIALKGKQMPNDQRPPSNLVFLLDVSGSMDEPNKLPLVKRGMQMLLEQLGEKDRVSIVVYAGAAGLVLPTTSADRRHEIHSALERLRAGGSTNGGDGVRLAYAMARDAFVPGGTNRVILCTDGDFNVGTTGTDELVRLVESEAKGGIYLTVLGFGMGNHNDAMLEQISGRGNGNYAFIDTENEARKVLVQQISGTLVTIAKDVKIQVWFNPTRVAAYRLIGYENRILAKEDFNDDKKDAGEIGAGHTVTALYELVPADAETAQPQPQRPAVDQSPYETSAEPTERAMSDELLTLKLRYKQPDEETSTLVDFPVGDDDRSFSAADKDFQFAAAVAGFGMLLRDSPYKGNWTYAAAREVAGDSIGEDPHGFRGELLRMIDRASALSGQRSGPAAGY